jgi:tetratricopeptide (TPR) repeat protein
MSEQENADTQPNANEEKTEQPTEENKTEESEKESEIITEEKVDSEKNEKPSTPQEFMKRAAQIRQEGNDEFRTEEYDAAILKYTDCLRIVDAVVRHIKENGVENFEEAFIEDVVKQRVTTYTNLGVAFKKIGNIRRAYEYICKALDNDENNMKALFVRAKIYYETKHYLEAKSDIDDLLQLSPTNKEALSLCNDIDAALKRARENDVMNTQQYVQRMQQMGMMGGMNIFEMMGMGGMGRYKSREEIEKEEMEKAYELSRQEFAREEEKRKLEEEEKKKVDEQQEEMRKYFESLKTPSGEDKVDDKVFEEEEDEDDDAFVLDDDDDDEDDDGEDGDDDDDDDDSEPVDNNSDDDE